MGREWPVTINLYWRARDGSTNTVYVQDHMPRANFCNLASIPWVPMEQWEERNMIFSGFLARLRRDLKAGNI
jgi:hypothetical protein